VKLADLGLARAMSDKEAAEAESGRAFGTPYYISPEQIRGEKEIGPPSDIYGLGATFYHMVTGRVPFEGKNPSEVMHRHLKSAAHPAGPPQPRALLGLRPDHRDDDGEAAARALSKAPASSSHDIDLVLRGERIPSTPGRMSISPQVAKSAARIRRLGVDAAQEPSLLRRRVARTRWRWPWPFCSRLSVLGATVVLIGHSA
jgi:serine/threonine protein kinase